MSTHGSEKNWTFRQSDPGAENRLLNGVDGLRPVVAKLLSQRGVTTPEQAQEFLNPKLEDLHSAEMMPGAVQAAHRVIQAVRDDERICIFGDFDVDGVTSTSILVKLLTDLRIHDQGEIEFYIPHRIDEGYGMNLEAINELSERGVNLLITVDCGINSNEEVVLANDLGMDVIITDHHSPKDPVPEAYAVVHPALIGSEYPFPFLAGVGVAYKLASVIASVWNEQGGNPRVDADDYLDLVALGTVADAVPLIGENRILVSAGFQRLRSMQAGTYLPILLSGTKVADCSSMTMRDISFTIAPLINAAGRIASARKCVDLLCATDQESAISIAEELREQNKRRREIQERVAKEARHLLEDFELEGEGVIVLGAENWHLGVLGIVASKLQEENNRPTVLLNIENGVAKGSGRSMGDFSLIEALSENQDLLDRFGGHHYAAGLSLQAEKIDELRTRLSRYGADRKVDGATGQPHVIDAHIDNDDVSIELARDIALLEPFGNGNEEPLFLVGGRLDKVKPVGAKGEHLKFLLMGSGAPLEAIAFRQEEPDYQDRCEIAAHIEINHWNSRERVQLKVADMRCDRPITMDNEPLLDLVVSSVLSDQIPAPISVSSHKQIVDLTAKLHGHNMRVMWLLPNEESLEFFSSWLESDYPVLFSAAELLTRFNSGEDDECLCNQLSSEDPDLNFALIEGDLLRREKLRSVIESSLKNDWVALVIDPDEGGIAPSNPANSIRVTLSIPETLKKWKVFDARGEGSRAYYDDLREKRKSVIGYDSTQRVWEDLSSSLEGRGAAHIVLRGCPRSAWELRQLGLSHWNRRGVFHLAYGLQEAKMAEEALKEKCPSEESLREFYRRIQELGDGCTTEKLSALLGRPRTSASLRILEEIGVVEWHGDAVKILPSNRRKLTESLAFRIGQKRLSAFQEFKNKALNMRPGQLEKECGLYSQSP